MARWSALLTITCCVLLFTEAQAQIVPGSDLPQNTEGILAALPSDVLAKVRQLAQLLQQNINEGKITDAQIQHELMSGNLQQTIKSINPEASHLLDDINASMKNSPNAESLPGLLGGLTGQAQ
ncbi:MAG: hypothetical protein KJS98_01770 [Nitrospirae bacterium]|nr:hypothetical protein [Nitrospirota bacterium]MDE3048648.1 hypothetical protein [Nitrospirota bacterium]MDE3219408.1 hypothetical protein [Nitrospirota bacterium]